MTIVGLVSPDPMIASIRHARVMSHPWYGNHAPQTPSRLFARRSSRLLTTRASCPLSLRCRIRPNATDVPQSDCRAGLDFHAAPGFRPQAAAAITVSTNSTNVMACTLVQYRQMLPMMNSSA